MKRSVVAMYAAGVALVAVTTGPAHAVGPNECITPTGLTCSFECHVNNDIRVEVTGVGTGRATCSNLSVDCTSPNGLAVNCGAWGVGYITADSRNGTCGFVGVGAGTVRCYAT